LALYLLPGLHLAGRTFAAEGKSEVLRTAEWRKQLVEWRKWFLSEELDEQASPDLARENVLGINDQAAIPALIAVLKTEKHPQWRRVLIQPLVKLANDDASLAFLVKLSVEDENPLLREEVAKGLVGKNGLEKHLDAYIAYLKSPKYVSNAAEALTWTRLSQAVSTVEKPNPKLAKALINALNAKQEKLMPYQIAFDTGLLVASDGRYQRTGRISGVDEGFVKVKIPVPQPEVLNALKEHTGQDYQYDQSQWNRWLESTHSR
jgi:hypothetical protein